MKTKLYLHNVDFDIDLLKKNDAELIKEKVRLDFAEFTSGTSEEYRNADRLLYLDNIRKSLQTNSFEDYLKEYMKVYLDYLRDIGERTDKIEIEFDYEFAERVFIDRECNFYKSGEKPALYNNLVVIIKTVMDYERETNDEQTTA